MHVGCVVTDATGADRALGTALITTFDDAAEIQPVAISVTIKLYVFDPANPESAVVAPDPETTPGLIVHAPDGNPLNETLPVGTEQVG